MLLAQPAQKKPQYTYVSEWGVPRGMWPDYEKATVVDSDILGKAVADGTLVSFGTYAVLAHQEGQMHFSIGQSWSTRRGRWQD